MKKRKRLLLGAAAAALCLGMGLYSRHYVLVAWNAVPRTAQTVDLRGEGIAVRDYEKLRKALPDADIRWDIPFQGGLYDSETARIRVDSLTDEDVQTLGLFLNLTGLEASRCTDYPQLLAFRSAHPDCTVEYRVDLGGKLYDGNSRTLRLADADIQELREKLPWFPELRRVYLEGSLPATEELEALCREFPGIRIRWEIPLGERTLSSKLTELNLSGVPMTWETTTELLDRLPHVEWVDMRGCGMTDAEMRKLADAYPEIFFLWEMTIQEVRVATDAEEIDISGQILSSTKEIEDLLPYFPNVKKVVMSHCGFDDETMDTLNKRYEDIRFVWSIQVQDVFIRTDTTFFYPFKYRRDMKVRNEELYPLRYCTDIVAVDIGHMWGVTDCEWAAFMPHLKYLVLVETQITDLTPLANAKELVYLEIFKTQITDYSPLLNCTALEDINMSRTYGDYRPIAQMTWLKNVWWNGIAGIRGYPCSGAEHVLPEALPNAKLLFYDLNNCYDNGWRDLANYKAMRDVMGMFYLK